MRPVDTASQDLRATRAPRAVFALVWLAATEYATGDPASIGLWSGPDDADITVTDQFTGSAVQRHFYGAGPLLAVQPPRFDTSLTVRAMTLSLSAIDVAAETAIRAYNLRGAQVQVWRRTYDASDMQPIGIEPWFKGIGNTLSIERPAVDLSGGQAEAVATLEVVSMARVLTIPSGLKKSHAAQQLRQGDMFRRYKAVIGDVVIPWGSERP